MPTDTQAIVGITSVIKDGIPNLDEAEDLEAWAEEARGMLQNVANWCKVAPGGDPRCPDIPAPPPA